jgi:hypothetical protein
VDCSAQPAAAVIALRCEAHDALPRLWQRTPLRVGRGRERGDESIVSVGADRAAICGGSGSTSENALNTSARFKPINITHFCFLSIPSRRSHSWAGRAVSDFCLEVRLRKIGQRPRMPRYLKAPDCATEIDRRDPRNWTTAKRRESRRVACSTIQETPRSG